MNSKKIGIITFHHVTNYGATLQAYALYHYICTLGYDVEIIDYRPLKAVWHYLKELLPIRRSGKKLSLESYFIGKILKSMKMRSFLKSHLKLSNKTFYSQNQLRSYKHDYDLVITGSDQVWCLDSIRGVDTSFFLDFIDSSNAIKISYAPSFGSTNNLKKSHSQLIKLLKQYQMISVRESKGLDILHNEGFKDVKKVLDPTFLIKYENLTKRPQCHKNYLLVYVHHGIVSNSAQTLIEKLVEKEELDIIAVGNYTSIAHKNLIGIGVSEWLGYFSQASYVITNSFHGVIFSILFKKNFSFTPYGNTNDKVTDLLETFDLETRILNNQPHSLDDQLKNINYSIVDSKRENLTKQSQEYLNIALSI